MNEGLLEELPALVGEHLVLTGIAILIALLISLPAAVALTRRPRLRRAALNAANIIQATPSLALFGLLLPVPVIGGIGKRTAIVVLVLYALLPLLRNAILGITGIDAAVRESAVAMGMTERQVLWQVELPLAIPAILTGVRVAAVTTVGTATIAAAIGGGGLGVLIFRGIATVDMAVVLAGALPAAVLAVLADEGIGWIERKLSPAYSVSH